MRYTLDKEGSVAHIQEHDRIGTPLQTTLCGKLTVGNSFFYFHLARPLCQECQGMLELVHDEAVSTVEICKP